MKLTLDLPEEPRRTAMVMIEEDGLPLIRCAPNAPASRMSIDELLALEWQIQLEGDVQRAGRAV